MPGFQILTQASCDLAPERLKALEVLVVPLPLTIDGRPYLHTGDEQGLNPTEFYQKLGEEALVKTAAPSPEDFIKLAEPALVSGQDLLYLGLAHTLSATYQSGVIAMEMLREKYPQRQIVCLDTLSGAMGEALLVEMAAKARFAGKTLSETAELITRKRLNTAHLFTLDDLDSLRRSGRLPAYQAVIGNLLNIKPILSLNKEGRFEVAAKVRGYRKALARLGEMVLSKAEDLKNQVIYISHANVLKEAELLAQKLRLAGAKEVVVTLLGPAIAGHFGPGGLGVAFLAKAR